MCSSCWTGVAFGCPGWEYYVSVTSSGADCEYCVDGDTDCAVAFVELGSEVYVSAVEPEAGDCVYCDAEYDSFAVDGEGWYVYVWYVGAD